MLAAHALILLAGTLWLAASIGLPRALDGGLVPFLPGAVIKSIVAAWLTARLATWLSGRLRLPKSSANNQG
jgi:biotin transporter BioY